MNKKIEELLDAIQYLVRINNQKLSDEEIEKANEEIKPLLKNYVVLSEGENRVIRPGNPVRTLGKDVIPLAIHYYAFTQDNLDLKEKLEDAGYQFCSTHDRLNLFSLDKMLSSKFAEKEYISLLMSQNKVFRIFYESLRFEDSENRDRYMADFADIMHENPFIAEKEEDNEFKGINVYNNLITKRNIQYFGKDFLLNATDEQKRILNNLMFKLEDRHFIKIKQLLEKYPNMITTIELRGTILDSFTVDELGTMSLKDARLYKIAIREGLFERMKKVLTLNPNFDCPEKFIRGEIWKALSDDEIVSLTDIGKMEIGNLKMPKSENAIITPVRKIRRAFSRDKRRIKKKEKEGKQKSLRL